MISSRGAPPEIAEQESGVSAARIVEVARGIAAARGAFSSHVWRGAASGHLGGWQVARALGLLGLKGEKVDPHDDLSLLSRQKNGALKASSFSTPDAEAMVRRVQAGYHSALHACNAVDFDDLLVLTLRLFQEHPKVLDHYRARFRYVMVDEYQDTNRPQYLLVRHLASEHRNLAVVGDPDQSIYKWRGADLRNIMDFEADYPEARVVRLERNYRSTSKILDAANSVIAQNVDRKGKTLRTERDGGEPLTLVECYIC